MGKGKLAATVGAGNTIFGNAVVYRYSRDISLTSWFKLAGVIKHQNTENVSDIIALFGRGKQPHTTAMPLWDNARAYYLTYKADFYKQATERAFDMMAPRKVSITSPVKNRQYG